MQIGDVGNVSLNEDAEVDTSIEEREIVTPRLRRKTRDVR